MSVLVIDGVGSTIGSAVARAGKARGDEIVDYARSATATAKTCTSCWYPGHERECTCSACKLRSESCSTCDVSLVLSVTFMPYELVSP